MNFGENTASGNVTLKRLTRVRIINILEIHMVFLNSFYSEIICFKKEDCLSTCSNDEFLQQCNAGQEYLNLKQLILTYSLPSANTAYIKNKLYK